jgi:endonuclease YncB( thermonuclease family)
MKILFLIILLTISTFGKDYGNAIVSEVTSIYDGDTFRVNIKGYPDIVGKRMSIRVNGIDTPEMRGKCQKEKDLARKEKQFTVSKLRAAKKIELRNMQRGKYFRIAADVYIDNKNLTTMLINKKLGVKYDGGSKVSWCNN